MKKSWVVAMLAIAGLLLTARTSPTATLATTQTSKFVSYTGEWDSNCPVEGAVEFHEALEAAGYDVTLTVLEQTGHWWPPYAEQMIMEVVRD